MLILNLIAWILTCVFAYRDGNNEPNKAGKFGLIFSALIPIVGIIIYFIQRSNIVDSSKYAKWAGIGFLVAVVCNFI